MSLAFLSARFMSASMRAPTDVVRQGKDELVYVGVLHKFWATFSGFEVGAEGFGVDLRRDFVGDLSRDSVRVWKLGRKNIFYFLALFISPSLSNSLFLLYYSPSLCTDLEVRKVGVDSEVWQVEVRRLEDSMPQLKLRREIEGHRVTFMGLL